VSASAANAPESGQRQAGPGTPRARLLVVEDEWLISSLVSDQLKELGFEVVGPASTIAEAVFLANKAAIDAALVDLSLGGVLANDVIDALSERKIPFIFVTGYSAIPEGVHATALLLEKPFTGDELVRAIESILPGR
jgi:DNA-binding response OmpR family regulator